MTETERDEQRRHWQFEARLLQAILGVLTAGLIGGFAWVITAEGRFATQSSAIDSLADRADRSDTRHAETMRRLGAAEAARAESAEAIARVEERLAAQGESLRRMENAITDLTEFLRERDGN